MKRSYAIGIDIGGSSLKCGVVDDGGKLLYSFRFPIDQTYTQGEIMALIIAAVRKCAAQAPAKVAGVGIGFPGIIDNNIVIGGADNLPDFIDVELGNIITASTHLNVTVDNDVNMMGTGVGGSLIINGQPYGGYKNRGAEMGHTTISHGGKRCACGALGWLEAYASVKALVSRYTELHRVSYSDEFTGQLIVKNYLAAEPQAITAMHEHFDYLSSGIAGFVNIFSSQKVVIGGGICEAGSFYIKEIGNRVKLKTIPVSSNHTSIVAAKLGNQAGLLGCAAKAFMI